MLQKVERAQHMLGKVGCLRPSECQCTRASLVTSQGESLNRAQC